MIDNTADNFFTKRHEKLRVIAYWANIFAWIVLVINILWAWASFFSAQANYDLQNINPGRDFWGMLLQNPTYLASLTISLIGIFLRGVVFWLVLRGVSVGLNMILETDLNYREQSQGENDEQ